MTNRPVDTESRKGLTLLNSHYGPAIDTDGRWYPDGPGDGFGYYSGLLWPWTRCVDEEEAKWLSKLLDIAYRAGHDAARREIQKALGL